MTDLNKVIVKYVGTGFLPGVPARDMTNDEAREYNISRLLKSGLYQIQRPKRQPRKVEAEPKESE